MSTSGGRAARWVAGLGVGAVVAAAAGWWAFDAWADRRLSAASEWLAEEPARPLAERDGGAAFDALRTAAPDLRWTEREAELFERLRGAEGRTWSPAELAAAREVLGPRRAEVERLGELVRSVDEGAAPGDDPPSASGAPAAEREHPADGPNPYADDLDLLRAGRLLAIDSRVALAEGDLERSVERVEDLGVLVRAFEGASGLAGQMFAASVEGAQLHAVADLVAAPAVDRSHVDRLLAALSDLDTEEALRRMMRLEAEESLATLESLPSRGPVDDALAKVAAAEIVEAYRELAVTPFAEAQRLLKRRVEAARSPRRPSDVIVAMSIPNFIEGVAKIQAAGAGRQLARTALELRLHDLDEGTYPAEPTAIPGAVEPDPFAGEPPRWEIGPDGAVLSNPAAAALWRSGDRRGGPPFVWRLPA